MLWFNDIEIDKKDGKLLIRDTDIEPAFLSGPGNVDLVQYVQYKYGDEISDMIIKRTEYEYKDFYKEFIPEIMTYYGVISIISAIIIFCIYKLVQIYII